MKSHDENKTQGKKRGKGGGGLNLVFSPKGVLRGVSPPVLDLP